MQSYDDPIDKESYVMMDDMILTKEDNERLFEPDSKRRNAIKDMDMIWPDKTLRYFIGSPKYTEAHKQTIREGTEMIKKVSCIKFEELKAVPSDGKPYLHISSQDGCYATVGAMCPPNGKCEMSLAISVRHFWLLLMIFLSNLIKYRVACVTEQ